MEDFITLRVTDIIGTQLCISAEDGQKVFEKIKKLLEQGKGINISFENATTLISLFLNVSIGQLYGSFPEDLIRSHIRIQDIAEDDRDMLRRVEENAKKYYANPHGYDTVWETGDDENEDEE